MITIANLEVFDHVQGYKEVVDTLKAYDENRIVCARVLMSKVRALREASTAEFLLKAIWPKQAQKMRDARFEKRSVFTMVHNHLREFPTAKILIS